MYYTGLRPPHATPVSDVSSLWEERSDQTSLLSVLNAILIIPNLLLAFTVQWLVPVIITVTWYLRYNAETSIVLLHNREMESYYCNYFPHSSLSVHRNFPLVIYEAEQGSESSAVVWAPLWVDLPGQKPSSGQQLIFDFSFPSVSWLYTFSVSAYE